MIADFEAGLGTLSRMDPGDVDLLLVVTEPSAKAVEVSRRALDLISEKRLGRATLVANRTRPEDRTRFEEMFAAQAMIFVPDDPELRNADAHGLAPFEAAAAAPAVRVLATLAESLVQSP